MDWFKTVVKTGTARVRSRSTSEGSGIGGPGHGSPGLGAGGPTGAGVSPIAAGSSTAAIQPVDRDLRAIELAFGHPAHGPELLQRWNTVVRVRRELPPKLSEVRANLRGRKPT